MLLSSNVNIMSVENGLILFISLFINFRIQPPNFIVLERKCPVNSWFLQIYLNIFR